MKDAVTMSDQCFCVPLQKKNKKKNGSFFLSFLPSFLFSQRSCVTTASPRLAKIRDGEVLGVHVFFFSFFFFIEGGL